MSVFEFDFTKEITASLTCNCDACCKALGESYAHGRDAMAMYLHMPPDADGYSQDKLHHFCNEACLLACLTKRAATRGLWASEIYGGNISGYARTGIS